MSSKKISALAVAGALDGTELVPVVQGGVTKVTASFASVDTFAEILPPYVALPARDNKVIPQLTPVDWYPDSIYGSDGTYLYGAYSASVDTLVRYPLGSHVATVGVQCSAGRSIAFVETTSTPGLIFIYVEAANGSGDIYRSTDYGATATKVLELGSRNTLPPVSGSRSPDVRWLSGRNFCEATIAGQKVLLIGEYNVGTARTIGGANDAVCLYRSNDAGLTWEIAAEWNTDGNTSYNDVAQGGNYVRHIHSVHYHDGHIYVTFGDVGSVGGVTNSYQAGILQWNGIQALDSNALLSSYAATGKKAISGSQIYRACDLLFEDDSIYYLTDATNDLTQPEYSSGVFKLAYDMGSVERINKSILEVPNRAGRMGAKHPAGNHVWVDSITGANTTAGAYFASLYTSSSDRQNYARNAVARTKTGGVTYNPQALFFAGSRLYLVMTPGSTIGKDGTAVCEFDATLNYNGERPDTIHPAYFVDTVNGTDDATTTSRILRGNAPGVNAWKTLQYAATGSRLPHGGRCALTAGTYAEAVSINPVFSTTLADTTEHVNFSGAGKELTIVGNSPAASNWLFGPVSGSVIQHWDFQDMRLTVFKGGVQQRVLLYTSYAYTGAFKLRLIRAEVGKRRGDISAVVATDDSHLHIPIDIAHATVALRPNIRMVDSALVYKNAADIHAGAVLLYHNNAAGLPVVVFDALRSVFWGGQLQHGGAASTMKLVDCIFGGCANANGMLRIMSSATVSPFGRGNIFESAWVTKQIVNSSTLPIVGAKQFTDSGCNQPLDDAAFFDAMTTLVVPGGQIKDPYANDYTVMPRY